MTEAIKDNSTKKTEFNKRFDSLKTEFQKYEAAFKELQTYINQTRGKFSPNETRGKMIDHKVILDDHAVGAQKVLASGMQSGMANPSRPWFRMNMASKDLNKVPAIREWLDDSTQRMLDVASNSNTYESFYSMYEEIGQFGTACAIILEDFDNVVRLRTFTIGEYYLGTDESGNVNAFAREYTMTVGQMVRQFGKDNVSAIVLSHYDGNRPDQEIVVRHLIEPNDKRDLSMVDNRNMAFRSMYWEMGNNDEKFLSTTGFEEFPLIAPRWDTVTSINSWGYGPGWFAVGNVKQLQKTALDELMAKEKLHNPPMIEDATVNGVSNYMPGAKTKTTGNVPNTGARPAYQINAQLESFIKSKEELKASIDKTFFVNIFLLMINFDKTNMTATEVATREQENIMMMGPLLTRINKEMLQKYLERLYAVMERNNQFLPPPEEIEGFDIKIEFISILAQAQKAIGAVSIDRLLGRVGNMMALDPSVVDNFDLDEAAREYADLDGTPAKIVRDPKVVKLIRDQREQAAQMATRLAAAEQGAETAKKLSETDMSKDSMLSRMAGGS